MIEGTNRSLAEAINQGKGDELPAKPISGPMVGITDIYELKVVRCNRGGYVVTIGNDGGAFSNINDALAFICKDMRTFMKEDVQSMAGMSPDPSYANQVQAELDQLNPPRAFKRPAAAQPIDSNRERGWPDHVATSIVAGAALVFSFVYHMSLFGTW